MTTVVLPNGDEVAFPDGMSERDMLDVIAQNFPQFQRRQAAPATQGILGPDPGIAQPSLLSGGPSFEGLSRSASSPSSAMGGATQRRGGLRSEARPYVAGESGNPAPKAKPLEDTALDLPAGINRDGLTDGSFDWDSMSDRGRVKLLRSSQPVLAKMGIIPPDQGPSASVVSEEALADKWGRKTRDYLNRSGISATWSAVNEAAGEMASDAGDAAMTLNKGIAMGAGLAFKATDLLTLGAAATDGQGESLFSRSARLADAIGEAATANQSEETRRQIADLGSANGFWDAAGKLAHNPRALLDMAASSGGGSMALAKITARGGGRLAVDIAASSGIKDAGTLGRIYAAGSEWGSGLGNVLMNAGDTFSETEADLPGKLEAAVIAAAGTKVADRMFQGGAEGALARGAKAYKEAAKTAMHEPGQEMVESLSQSAGQAMGEGRSLDLDKAAGQALIEAAAAAPAGGIAALHMAREASKLPPERSAEDIARANGFLGGAGGAPSTPSRQRASATPVRKSTPPVMPQYAVFTSEVTESAGLLPVTLALQDQAASGGSQLDLQAAREDGEADSSGEPTIASSPATGQDGIMPADVASTDVAENAELTAPQRTTSVADSQLAAVAGRVLYQAMQAPGRDSVRPLSPEQLEEPLRALEKRGAKGTLTAEWFASSPIAMRLDIRTAAAFNQALRADPAAAARALRESLEAASLQASGIDGTVIQPAPAAATASPALTATVGATFKEGSGPVGANGEPLPLYVLSEPGGTNPLVHLTSSREAALWQAQAHGDTQAPEPLHAVVQRPYMASADSWNALRNGSPDYIAKEVEALRAQSHDGVAFAHPDGSLEVMAFDSSQVRSATQFADRAAGRAPRFPRLVQLLRRRNESALPVSVWRQVVKGWMKLGPVEARDVQRSGLLGHLARLRGRLTRGKLHEFLSDQARTAFGDGQSDETRPAAGLTGIQVEDLLARLQKDRKRHTKGRENVRFTASSPPTGAEVDLAIHLSRVLGRHVLFVKADGNTKMNAVNFQLADGSHVTIINKGADDSVLAMAMHEALHGMDKDLKQQLITALFDGPDPLVGAEHIERFQDLYPDYAEDERKEEIVAMLVQQNAKKRAFWERLRVKVGDKAFGKIVGAILAQLEKIIAAYGRSHALELTRDAQQVSDLLSDMFAEMVRRKMEDEHFEAWYGCSLDGEPSAIARQSLAGTTAGEHPDGGEGLQSVIVGDATFPETSGPVDEDGRPLAFFVEVPQGAAGTESSRPGRKAHGWLGHGVYLRSGPKVARDYARGGQGSKGSTLVPVFANVRRPFVLKASFGLELLRHATPAFIEAQTRNLQGHGFDGVAFQHADGTLELVAFDASQVRSAASAMGAGRGLSEEGGQGSYSDQAGREQRLLRSGVDAPQTITTVIDGGVDARRLPLPLNPSGLRRGWSYGDVHAAIDEFQGGRIPNIRTGMVATASRSALEKLVPAEAFGEFAPDSYLLLAVANADRLFEHAMLGWSKPDLREGGQADVLHKFFAPIQTPQGLRLVQITVREGQDQQSTNQQVASCAIEAVAVSGADSALEWVQSLARADGVAAAPNNVIDLAGAIQSGDFKTQDASPGNRGKKQRIVDKTAQLSPAQTATVNAACEQEGLDSRQTARVLARALHLVRSFPQSAGWAALEFQSLCARKARDGKKQFKLYWKGMARGFDVPAGQSRAPQEMDEAHLARIVREIVGDVNGLHQRARQGDQRARDALAQRHWFRDVTERIWRDFGAQGPLLAELLGATSARTTVKENWIQAMEILQRFSAGDFDEQMRAFAAHLKQHKSAAGFDKDHWIRRADRSPYGVNTLAVMLVLADQWQDTPPGTAPKTRNYALNLKGVSDMATIDTWVARYLTRMADLPLIPPPAERALTGEWRNDPRRVTGEYGFGAEALRRAAAELSKLLGYELTPPQLQSIIWFNEKARWADQGLAPETGAHDTYGAQFDSEPMDRYMVPMGVVVLSDDAAALAEGSASRNAGAVCELLQEDPAVMTTHASRTVGPSDGKFGRGVGVEWVAKRGKFNAARVLAERSRLAKEAGEDAFFISRVLQPHEASTNARPGAEVYFKPGATTAEVEAAVASLKANDLYAFTLITDPRVRAQSGGKVIGLRVQYVPEFDKSATAQNVGMLVNIHSIQLNDIVRELHSNEAVASAAVYSYDTEVVFKENYDAHIDRAAAVGDQATGGPAWPERSLRARLEEATARVSAAPGSASGGPLLHARRSRGSGHAEGRIGPGERHDRPARSGPVDLPDAIIANPLGAASAHPDYAAAKAGDARAALRLVEALVTPELVLKLQILKPDAIVAVMAQEATGRNKIPLMMAVVLAQKTGARLVTDIVQSNSPRRTGLRGVDRLFASPRFEGFVEQGISYVIADDTATQGSTLANLGDLIQRGGGRVVGVAALTGKQYSAKLSLSQETLHAVRAKFGNLEAGFRHIVGYGFDRLTASEGNYLASIGRADAFRNRILAGRDETRRGLGDENAAGA